MEPTLKLTALVLIVILSACSPAKARQPLGPAPTPTGNGLETPVGDWRGEEPPPAFD